METLEELVGYLKAFDMEALEEVKKLERNVEAFDGEVKKVRRRMEKVDGVFKELERNMETDGIVKELERFMETVDGRVNELEWIVKQLKATNNEISRNLYKETIVDGIKNAPRVIDLNALNKWKENGANFSRVLYKQGTLWRLAVKRTEELEVLIKNGANVVVM